MTATIAARAQTKRYGKVCALDGVDLEIGAGVTALLGPNGAGKTTFVRAVATLVRPDGGSLHVGGFDAATHPRDVRRLIGLAGQYATVDENLTGRENLKMVGRLCHMPKRAVVTRADELLEQFDLTDAANRPLKTYSGGMRRRVDVAAALVARPPILFLDEPTTGLDPSSRQDLWSVIEHLVASGTTVLLTTQYLEEADRLAGRVIVIDHGKVIAEGTPAELKAGLGTTVISVTLHDPASAPSAAALLHGLSPHEASVDGPVVELTVEDGPKVAAEVLRTLDQHRVEVAGLALREPSLDDVFLSLTGHRAEDDAAATGRGDPAAVAAQAGAVGQTDHKADHKEAR